MADTESHPDSWLRRNVIDVAPIWAEFIQIAFANVRIEIKRATAHESTDATFGVPAGRRP
jgi:hypothetical protein